MQSIWEIEMTIFTKIEPLTDAELDRLGDFLRSCKGGKAMNLEELDGFFAALFAGPETVMPSEYYREVFGGEITDACEFSSLEEANEIFGLMMRHWNTIAGTLFKGEVCVPLLLQREHGGWLVPMMMLYHEHDEDPKMRPKPITPEKREDIITHMAAGLVGAYRYFREHQKAYAGSASAPESRRTTSKVGRNDPCPCGSGKKYKKCCGGATVNYPLVRTTPIPIVLRSRSGYF